MLQPVAKIGSLSLFALFIATTPAEAFGRRHSSTYYHSPTYCRPSCWSPCEPCPVYSVSLPVEPLNGPYHTILRAAHFGRGVIVQVDAPGGVNPTPTGVIQVIQSGPGEMKYVGYNACAVSPGMPGSPVRYSVFLCPTKAGRTDLKVGFVMSDNTIVNVPFSFNITG